MKKSLLNAALFCAVAVSTFAMSPIAARAEESPEIVRSAQMRLSELGYFVGRYDGVMGNVTRSALQDFQRNNNLAVTGELTPDTFNLLARQEYSLNHDYGRHTVVGYYDTNGFYHAAAADRNWATPVWEDRWTYLRDQSIDSRFANVNLREEDRGSMREYTLTVNGHAVLFANNQPYVLRVSQTFPLDHEDAIMLTGYQGEGTCAFKHYLVTVHRDGSFDQPREVGSCAANYEAHVASNALIIDFSRDRLANGLLTWDTFKYENGMLIRL